MKLIPKGKTETFDIVFFLSITEFPPNEGLIVLLSELLKGLERLGVRPRIFLSRRHARSLAGALVRNGVAPVSYDMISYRITPFLVRLRDFMTRRTSLRTKAKTRLLAGIRPRAAQAASAAIDWLLRATARAGIFGTALLAVAMGCIVLPLAAVTMAIAATFLTLRLLGSASGRVRDRVIATGRQHRSVAISARSIIWKGIRLYRLYSRQLTYNAVDLEGERLGRAVSRRRDVRAVFFPTAFAGEAVRATYKPTLVVFPDVVPAVFPTRFLGIGTRDMEGIRMSMRHAAVIICYSAHVAQHQLLRLFADEANGKAVRVIPQGFYLQPLDENIPPPRLKFFNHFTEFCEFIPTYRLEEIEYIAYPSVDRPHKGMVTLVRGIDFLIRRKHRPLKMITTSHAIGPDTSDQIREKRLFLDCLFAPSLSEPDLMGLVRHSQMLVHPSLSEGGDIFNFSRGVSLGVPVLMADIPMSREMFDRYDVPFSTYSPWLFDPRDYRSLADLIERTLEHRQMVFEQQAAVVERLCGYDFTRMALAYYDAYHAVTHGARGDQTKVIASGKKMDDDREAVLQHHEG